jgi:hypothetical protein
VAKFLAGRFFKALEKHIDQGKKEAKDASAASANCPSSFKVRLQATHRYQFAGTSAWQNTHNISCAIE